MMHLFVALIVGLAGPSGQSRPAEVADHLRREVQRSKPDYITFVPRHYAASFHDNQNEHFLVFEGPGGKLMAVWTQNVGRPGYVNRIVFSDSPDGGRTWTPPAHVAGPRTGEDAEPMASWAFPMVSRSGRIYVLYNQNDGTQGWIKMHTGRMDGVYSDDGGKTWSGPQTVSMPASPFDDPAGKSPPEWIVWQNPVRDLQGRYFVGYTHWLHPERALLKEDADVWSKIESVVSFMRFLNVDADPEVRDLEITWSAWGDRALRVPHYLHPLLSVAQEPSIVRLPDDRLFCTMRTNSGYIWYSVSADDGQTWCNPRPLLRKDHGRPILQPVACCPIYALPDGRYVLLHHNNRGQVGPPEMTWSPRRPAFIALGEFRPTADQPIWFSESKVFMDNDGYRPDGTRQGDGRPSTMTFDIGVYSSFTSRNGENVLWHPDRKFFLVGKKIVPEFLADLTVDRE